MQDAKCYNALNANDNVNKLLLLTKVIHQVRWKSCYCQILPFQGKQDLRMLNVFCATIIILQITIDAEYIKNYKATLRKKTVNSSAPLTSSLKLI
jgi:hypothetical protein